MEHQYHLQKYAGPSTRHTCPACNGKRCFTLYVDETGEPLASSVGRCDHESSCGYHYTPSQFFADNPDASKDWRDNFMTSAVRIPKPQQPKQKPLCTIPSSILERSINPLIPSDFTRFLISLFGQEKTAELVTTYRLGVTKSRNVIFFQIDFKGRCRTGKIMKYNPETGKRIKDEKTSGKVNWVHSLMKKNNELPPDWELTQCLFGEHLLKDNPGKPIALVESEKTAVICSAASPQYIWLATGGKSQLNSRLEVLKGRQIIAFPDIDGYEQWKEKLSDLKGYTIKVSDYLETIATDELRAAHIDIADIYIEEIKNLNRHPESSTSFRTRSGISTNWEGVNVPVPLSQSTEDRTTRTPRDNPSPYQNPNFLQVAHLLSEDAIGSVAALIDDFDLVPIDVWQ